MMRLDRIYGQLTEAFRAGNRARKKESAQDAVEDIRIPFNREFVRKWLVKNLFNFLCHITTDAVHFVEYRHNDYRSLIDHEIIPDDFDDPDEIKEMFIPVHFWVRDDDRDELCDWIMALDVFDDGMEIRGMSIETYDDFSYTCQGVNTLNFAQKFHEALFEIQRQLLYKEPIIEDPNDPVMIECPFEPRPANEAFKAGNRARKKESVQDTVDSARPALEQIFQMWAKIITDRLTTGYHIHKVEIRPEHVKWFGHQENEYHPELYYGSLERFPVTYKTDNGTETNFITVNLCIDLENGTENPFFSVDIVNWTKHWSGGRNIYKDLENLILFSPDFVAAIIWERWSPD